MGSLAREYQSPPSHLPPKQKGMLISLGSKTLVRPENHLRHFSQKYFEVKRVLMQKFFNFNSEKEV